MKIFTEGLDGNSMKFCTNESLPNLGYYFNNACIRHPSIVYICFQLLDDSTTSICDGIPPPVSSTTSTFRKSCINVMLRSGEDLQWDQKIHLVGRCVKDPAMHICESCSLPVLIYGRMVSRDYLHRAQKGVPSPGCYVTNHVETS